MARDGQKKIVIGEGGRMIKSIGQAAQRTLRKPPSRRFTSSCS